MIYQPSYMQPYLSDVDALIDNSFSCVINADGGSVAVAYDITINDMNGKQIYTSNKQTLTTPIYNDQQLIMPVPKTSGMVNGIDYVWNVRIYQTLPSIWVTYGTVKTGSTTTSINISKTNLIKAGMYLTIGSETRLITNYDAETGVATTQAFTTSPTENAPYTVYCDYVISNDTYFKARTTPTLTLVEVPSTITTKSYTFQGVYTQAQGVNYKYFVWTLYNSKGVEIEKSKELSTGQIQYRFDGFISDNIYGISLFLENQDGVTLKTPIQYFTVNYAMPEIANAPSIEVLCDKTALRVKWSNPLVNVGVPTGTYHLVPNQPYQGVSSVQIDNNSNIAWDLKPSGVPYESTTFINWATDQLGFSGNILSQVGEKIPLVNITVIAPVNCIVGDKYYNPSTQLIYDCASTNVWNTKGYTPSETELYFNQTNNKTYIWDKLVKDLVETNEDVASYSLSYANGIFYYEINNLDTTINGSVMVKEILDKWLLQSDDIERDGVSYIWNDSATWDDSYFWVENTIQTDYVTKNWFKITMLPTGVQVKVNPRI